MARALYLFSTVVFYLGVVSCSPVAPAPQETPALATRSAEPYLPLSTQTGIPVVDQILSAVSAGDRQGLRALVEFTEAKCTKVEGLGGPPRCQEGEAEGTETEVLPFLGGEGSYLRKEEIGNWPGIASGLYAVYEVSPAVSSEQYFPVGKYVILLVNAENASGAALRVGERGIVRVDTLFDISPESLDAMIQREASKVLLTPKN